AWLPTEPVAGASNEVGCAGVTGAGMAIPASSVGFALTLAGKVGFCRGSRKEAVETVGGVMLGGTGRGAGRPGFVWAAALAMEASTSAGDSSRASAVGTPGARGAVAFDDRNASITAKVI